MTLVGDTISGDYAGDIREYELMIAYYHVKWLVISSIFINCKLNEATYSTMKSNWMLTIYANHQIRWSGKGIAGTVCENANKIHFKSCY